MQTFLARPLVLNHLRSHPPSSRESRVNAKFMNQPAVLIFMAILGTIAGAFSQRLRASGVAALLLPLAPGLALCLALTGDWG